MAILSAIFSLLSQKIGTLLQAVFGWSITGLFGRLSNGKQTALSVAMILALAWPLLVLGAIFPDVGAWAIAFVPLHKLIGDTALRIVWLVLAVVAPIVVGFITRSVAPSRAQKGGALRTIVSGYPLTIGFFCAFVITLVVVPALKIGAVKKGWEDEHVYVQPFEGKYRQVLASIAEASARAGLPMHESPMPRAMSLATRVLKWFARSGLDPIVADNPKKLAGEGVELYLYPADLLLRGKKGTVARVRAALARELLRAPAHLAGNERAQELEDEIQRMWDVVERHHGQPIGGLARGRLHEIATALDHTELEFDEWILLYTNLQRLERAVCGGPRLIDPDDTTETHPPQMDPRHA